MILTVNIGNTHITVGGYEQDTLIFCGRLHSDPAATVEEYAIRLVNLLQLYGASPAQIEGGILGSVVPMLSGRVLAALQLLCKARILTVGPAFTTNKLDPLFENNDLKASGTGIYQEVFDNIDYGDETPEEAVNGLLDGMESVGYTIA